MPDWYCLGVLEVNDARECKANIILKKDKETVFNFKFDDLMGNSYFQSITLNKDGMVIRNTKPELIKQAIHQN